MGTMRIFAKFTFAGKLGIPYKSIMDAASDAVDEIGEVVIKEAIIDYLQKKKTDSPRASAIIASFDSTPPTRRGTVVSKTVFCGGPQADWAVHLNDGHINRDKITDFKGHHFMEAGIEAGRREAEPIIRKHLKIRDTINANALNPALSKTIGI